MSVNLNENDLLNLIKNLDKKQIIIIKFTASWCMPCKTIEQICNKYIKDLPKSILYYEIDIDNSIELYLKFKKNRMLNGIPSIFAFYPIEKDIWYIPDDSVLGSDINKVEEFFNRCLNYVK